MSFEDIYRELFDELKNHPEKFCVKKLYDENIVIKEKLNVKKMIEFFSIYVFRIKNWIDPTEKLLFDFVLESTDEKYYKKFKDNIEFLVLQRFIKYELDENTYISYKDGVLEKFTNEDTDEKKEEAIIAKSKKVSICKPKKLTKKDLYAKCVEKGHSTDLKLGSLSKKELEDCLANNTELRQKKSKK